MLILQIHNHSIDPSQNQEVKINEIDQTIEEVKDYIKNQGDRNDFEIDLTMRQLYGKDWEKLVGKDELKLQSKEFLDSLASTLKETGADQQN